MCFDGRRCGLERELLARVPRVKMRHTQTVLERCCMKKAIRRRFFISITCRDVRNRGCNAITKATSYFVMAPGLVVIPLANLLINLQYPCASPFRLPSCQASSPDEKVSSCYPACRHLYINHTCCNYSLHLTQLPVRVLAAISRLAESIYTPNVQSTETREGKRLLVSIVAVTLRIEASEEREYIPPLSIKTRFHHF